MPGVDLVIAGLWILFSDLLVASLPFSVSTITRVQIAKGWVFVGVTGGLLYFYVRRRSQLLEAARAERDEAERALNTLMDNLPGMAYRVKNNDAWTALFISQGARDLTGYEPKEFLEGSVDFGDLIVPEDRERVWTTVQAALEERRPFRLTYRITTKAGEERWVWEQGVGVFDPDASPPVLEGFITDLTELRSLQDTLLRVQRVESVGRMAGGLAHDFGNAMTVISTSLESLKRRLPATHEVSDPLRRIENAVEYADRLVKDLSMIARRPLGEDDLVDLCQAARNTKPMVDRLVSPEVDVTWRIPDGPVMTRVDRGEVEQAIVNLVLNADDAIEGSGRVTVRVGTESNGRGQTKAGSGPITRNGDQERADESTLPSTGHNWAILEVEDNGCGMDSATQRRALEPLFTTKPSGEGSGLGLYMVDLMARRRGGEVSLESELGSGTMVQIRLPGAKGQAT